MIPEAIQGHVELSAVCAWFQRRGDWDCRAAGPWRSRRWSREGQVGWAGMVAVICLIRPKRLDILLDAAFAVVEAHIGVVSVTDAMALRAERF